MLLFKRLEENLRRHDFNMLYGRFNSYHEWIKVGAFSCSLFHSLLGQMGH